MKSVLLTGATGFVGQHAIQPLLNKNYVVHATYTTHKPLIDVIWHKINLHEHDAVEKLMAEIQPSHLLHAAWYAKPNEYWTSPYNIDWLTTSLHLLKSFIKNNGKRAVFVGTCAEYDWQHNHCQEFSTPCAPKTLYGRAKHSLHLLSDALAKQQDLSFAWGRLFFLFGRHEYPQRLIPAAINKLLKNQHFDVMHGYQTRDFMYVTDVADALVALLDSQVTGPVNIASGEPVKIHDFITAIGTKLNKSEWLNFATPAQLNDSVLTADTTRLLTEVKWQPTITLDQALDETIHWWSEQI